MKRNQIEFARNLCKKTVVENDEKCSTAVLVGVEWWELHQLGEWALFEIHKISITFKRFPFIAVSIKLKFVWCFSLLKGRFLINLIILRFAQLYGFVKIIKTQSDLEGGGAESRNLISSSQNNNTEKNIDKSWLRRKSTTKNVPRPRRSNKF